MVVHASYAESSLRTGAAVVGIGLPSLFGGLFGAAFAVAGWDGPCWANGISGVICGGVAQLAVGCLVTTHAFAIAHSDLGEPNAPIWGLVPAGLIGGMAGIGLGGLIGLAFGHAADGALIGGFGLIGGPASWEVAFLWARFARNRSACGPSDPSDGGLFVDGTGTRD